MGMMKIEIGNPRIGRHSTPESWGDFSSQDADGERLRRQICPVIGTGVGGRGSGVKAIPQARDRSPSPGGITSRLGADGGSWGLRRKMSQADGGLEEMQKTPDLAVSSKRTGFCHPSGMEDFLCGKAPHSTLLETPEYPEWVWTATSQSAANKMVTCVDSASYRVVLVAGVDVGRHVRPLETGAPNVGFHPWGGPLVCRFLGPPAPWNPVPSVLPHAGLRRRPQPAGRRLEEPRLASWLATPLKSTNSLAINAFPLSPLSPVFVWHGMESLRITPFSFHNVSTVFSPFRLTGLIPATSCSTPDSNAKRNTKSFPELCR